MESPHQLLTSTYENGLYAMPVSVKSHPLQSPLSPVVVHDYDLLLLLISLFHDLCYSILIVITSAMRS